MIKAILLILLGLLIIFAIARKCKSTKIFWILLVSLFTGFVGGSIAAHLFIKKVAIVKKNNCLNINAKSTHIACVNLFANLAHEEDLTSSSRPGYVSKVVLPSSKVKHYFTQLFTPLNKCFIAFSPDIDIGNINTS